MLPAATSPLPDSVQIKKHKALIMSIHNEQLMAGWDTGNGLPWGHGQAFGDFTCWSLSPSPVLEQG